MASGFLSGKYQKTDVYTGDDVRRVITRFAPENVEANQPLLLILQRFAEQKHAPRADLPCVDALQKTVSGADSGNQKAGTSERKCESGRYHVDRKTSRRIG